MLSIKYLLWVVKYNWKVYNSNLQKNGSNEIDSKRYILITNCHLLLVFCTVKTTF